MSAEAYRESATMGGLTVDGADCSVGYILVPPGIGGLGNPAPKVNVLDQAGADGAAGGTDYLDVRQLTVPTLVKAFDNGTPQPHTVRQLFQALKAAWQPDPLGEDSTLLLDLPGIGTTDDSLLFYGRPRTDMAYDGSRVYAGQIRALLTFDALDPLGYGPPVTVSGSGTITVTNTGQRASRRGVLTLTGTGGTPVIVNNDDAGGAIIWNGVLANAATRIIDLQTMRVTDGSGLDRAMEVASSSTWFALQPGANELVVTGAGNLSATVRPAHL